MRVSDSLRAVRSAAALAALVPSIVASAQAATCVRGAPVVRTVPPDRFGCGCFDKDPPGTRIFSAMEYGIGIGT